MKKKVVLTTAILTLSVGSIASAFSDVSSGKWYHSEIMELKSNGIVNGYVDGTFRPYNNVSNVEALAMILRSLGVQPSSSNQGNWSDGIVASGSQLGIIDDNNFQRDASATREQVAEMIVKALELENTTANQNVFSDSSSKYANMLYERDILKGEVINDVRYFKPNRLISRAEVGAMVIRVVEYLEKLSDSNEADVSESKDYTDAKYFEFNSSKGEITGYSDDAPKDLVIPREINGVKVTSIGEEAFRSSNLESVEISDSIIAIGRLAFAFNSLVNINIPNSVTDIEGGAFAFNSLVNINIPNSITDIEASVFRNNNLENVKIPNSVLNIGSGAFMHNNLENVKIPSSVGVIDDNAFAFNNLTSVKVPGHTDLGSRVFDYRVRITKYIHAPEIEGDTDAKYFEFNSSKGEITGYSDDAPKDVVIPREINGVKVTSIGEKAFESKNLMSVQIPNSVTDIEIRAFRDNNLTAVEIPNSVTSIEAGAFGRNSLMVVKIPSSVTSIGSVAFRANKLREVRIYRNTEFEKGVYHSFDLLVEIIRY